MEYEDDDGSDWRTGTTVMAVPENSRVRVSVNFFDFWNFYFFHEFSFSYAASLSAHMRLRWPMQKSLFSYIFGCMWAARPYAKIDLDRMQNSNM